MAMQDTRSESDRFMSGLEHDRGMQCLWQEKANGGKRLIEMFYYPKAQTYLIAVKDYEKSVSGKTWPRMIGCQVFAPIDSTNSWDGLEKALDELETKGAAHLAKNGLSTETA